MMAGEISHGLFLVMIWGKAIFCGRFCTIRMKDVNKKQKFVWVVGTAHFG
jgi:hypothetical protein